MTELFIKIVNMSITASILVLLVLVMRLLFRRAPKWIHVLLWGLVAIRLICPFDLESTLSLMPRSEWIEQTPPYQAETVIPDVIDPQTIISQFPDTEISTPIMPPPEITVHRGGNLNVILPSLWVVGIAGMLVYLLISYLRIYLRIRDAVKFRDNICTSGKISSPFVFGLFRPRICLPDNMDAVDMSYVIAHEEAHICRGDHIWKPFGFLLLSLHWFNPVIWLGYVILCRDIESACDERVVKEYSDVQRADYSDALLACSIKRSMITACPLAFGEVSVKSRIKSVLHYKKPAFWIVVLAVIASVVAAVCFLTNPTDKTVLAMEEHTWYFERAFMTDDVSGSPYELYQPGQLPEMETSIPMNMLLVPGDKALWYEYITGDWDINRSALHFIPVEADHQTARYTFEMFRDTGEAFGKGEAVMERMSDSDEYILTLTVGEMNRLIFTTQQPPVPAVPTKQLTLEDAIALSDKGMGLIWEDFADYIYTEKETDSGYLVCVYEIDDIFRLEITGGSMYGTPMTMRLFAMSGDEESSVDFRLHTVKEFIDSVLNPPVPQIAEPAKAYADAIVRDLVDVVSNMSSAYNITLLEEIDNTGAASLYSEYELYHLQFWITKGINGLDESTNPDDVFWGDYYFKMLRMDGMAGENTWTELGYITAETFEAKYNTPEMIDRYGNPYTAAAMESWEEDLPNTEIHNLFQYNKVRFRHKTAAGQTITAELGLCLPKGWDISMGCFASYEVIPFAEYAAVSHKEDAVGGIGFLPYEVPEGQEDNRDAIFSQIAMGAVTFWDIRGQFDIVTDEGMPYQTALTSVLYSSKAFSDGVERRNSAIVTYHPEYQMYIAMQFNDGIRDRTLLSEEELRYIADSITWLGAEFSNTGTDTAMQSDLFRKTEAYLSEEFHRVYDPYYEILDLAIFDWTENGSEATFRYRKTYQHWNRDPDTVDFILAAKEEDPLRYEMMYRDYLAPKESNFFFKIVMEGDQIRLYSNVSPTGVEWEPREISDYILNS